MDAVAGRDTPAVEGVHATSSGATRRAASRARPSCSAVHVPKGVPLALSHNCSMHRRVLHEHVLLVAVTTTAGAADPRGRATSSSPPLSEGLIRVELRFGFMRRARVPRRWPYAMARGTDRDGRSRTGDLFHTGATTIIPSGRRPGLPRRREEALFALMHHNAQRHPARIFQNSGRANHGDRRRI